MKSAGLVPAYTRTQTEQTRGMPQPGSFCLTLSILLVVWLIRMSRAGGCVCVCLCVTTRTWPCGRQLREL